MDKLASDFLIKSPFSTLITKIRYFRGFTKIGIYSSMNKDKNNFPCIPIPPGATVKEQLVYCGMSQKEFACRMNFTDLFARKFLNGKVDLTPEIALRLESLFGIQESFWLNLESIYRKKLALKNKS